MLNILIQCITLYKILRKKDKIFMELVQPIRDKKLIEEIKTELSKQGYRDFLMFVTGINTGLRISDLLTLRVSDVKDKSHILIKEEKTGKEKRFLINDNLKNHIDKYINTMNDDEYLFKSREGNNKPLTRTQAYRIINNATQKVGITDRIGTHTLRKTFGYWHYQQFKDVAILQDIFNHSAPSVTLRYIGINDDIKDKTIAEFSL